MGGGGGGRGVHGRSSGLGSLTTVAPQPTEQKHSTPAGVRRTFAKDEHGRAHGNGVEQWSMAPGEVGAEHETSGSTPSQWGNCGLTFF